MKNIDFAELPVELVDYISQLRKEAQQMRRQRNGARAEADRLRAELAARNG
uniref:Minor tail protein n=1 Tax=Mycolicibacterium phage Alyssa1 TaxID=3240801 RepID=A0AB39U1U0_9CAUD